MELAIDTSLGIAGLALCHEGQIAAELSWHSPQNQSAELLPSLEFLLHRAAATLADIRLVAVARGPGSFNGVRVGLATAKGLALGLGVPLVGVSTLEALAFPLRGVGRPLCAIIPAGRGQVAAALFLASPRGWRRLKAEHLTTPQELALRLPRRTLICGYPPTGAVEALSAGLSAMDRQVGRPSARSPSLRSDRTPSEGYPVVAPPPGTAAGVAALGWERFRQGRVDSPARLRPLYLRPPSITQPRPFQEVAT